MTADHGDEAWLRGLLEGHGAEINRYVIRRMADAADAEDVVAEVFASAWRSADACPEDPGRQRAWLYTIARNAVADQYRRRGRWSRLIDRVAATTSTQDVDAPDLPSDPALADALGRLRPADREVLRLVAWEQLSHREIARVLGCREPNVAVRLHRARHRLQRELDAARATTTAPARHDARKTP